MHFSTDEKNFCWVYLFPTIWNNEFRKTSNLAKYRQFLPKLSKINKWNRLFQFLDKCVFLKFFLVPKNLNRDVDLFGGFHVFSFNIICFYNVMKIEPRWLRTSPEYISNSFWTSKPSHRGRVGPQTYSFHVQKTRFSVFLKN